MNDINLANIPVGELVTDRGWIVVYDTQTHAIHSLHSGNTSTIISAILPNFIKPGSPFAYDIVTEELEEMFPNKTTQLDVRETLSHAEIKTLINSNTYDPETGFTPKQV